MPVPMDIGQNRIVINGQRANKLGRKPKVLKPWREKINHIDSIALRVRSPGPQRQ